MLRSSVIGIGLAVTALLAFQVGGCGSSGGGGGGSTGTAGTTATGKGGSSAAGTGGTTTGGTTGTGGTSTTGTGGTSTTGTGGTGGTSTTGRGGIGGTSTTGTGGTGGTSATGTGGTGGSSTAGTGGSSTAGTGGSGTGGTGTGGSGTGGTPGFGQPACAGTVTKGGTCTATDTQLCYKTCGPQNLGRKSETCTAGGDGGMTYMEMSGCSYDPAGNYACYKVPTTANTACPAGAPMGSAACTVADSCTLCNDMGGVAGGMYMDSSGMKQGFCVCVNSKWTCASNTAWPCGGTPTPNNPGCQ